MAFCSHRGCEAGCEELSGRQQRRLPESVGLPNLYLKLGLYGHIGSDGGPFAQFREDRQSSG